MDVSGIVNIIDIVNVADIVTDIADIPLCSNDFMHFSYMQASQANLKALYYILIDIKPLVSAVAWRQGCWRLIDVFNAQILR